MTFEVAAAGSSAVAGAQQASPAQAPAGLAVVSGSVVFVIGSIEHPEAGLESRPDLKEILMKIGELAVATSTPVETIRFYEKEGLMPLPHRSEGNYRIYGQGQLERLTFIRHCRLLDMTLDEIRALLIYKDAPESNCAEVNELLDAHIDHVMLRIRDLRSLENQLKILRAQCATSDSAGACGILKELSSDANLQALKRSGGRHVHGTH